MSEKQVKKYSLAEVREKADAKKSWIVINDNVYDVTEFLNDVRLVQLLIYVNFTCRFYFYVQHPGGEEVLLEQAGKDATEEFEDVGHSSDAREVMQKYKVGELVDVSPISNRC